MIGLPNPIPPTPNCYNSALRYNIFFFIIRKFLSFDFAPCLFVAEISLFLSLSLYILVPKPIPIFYIPNLYLILLVYSSARINPTSAITAPLFLLTLIPIAARYPEQIGY